MEPIIGMDTSGAQATSGLVTDSSTANFAHDVIDASMETPVIVDFWAPWCGPCKQLGPALEKAVTAARGAVRLVKIDIDQNQELATQMRVQSIPTVYAFFQGRPIDGFQGALPESQIKSFIDRLVEAAGAGSGPNPVEQALEEAQAALDARQTGAASALFAQVLQHDPENATATAGVIRCKLAAGDTAGAKEIFESLPDDLRKLPEFGPIAASLELAESSADAGDVAGLMDQVARDQDDHQARFDLAMALYAADKRDAAAGAMLEIIRRDREWNDDAARKQLVKFFEAWGPTDRFTLQARRRLSALLFS